MGLYKLLHYDYGALLAVGDLSQKLLILCADLIEREPRSSILGKKSSMGRTCILSTDDVRTQLGKLNTILRLNSELNPWLLSKLATWPETCTAALVTGDRSSW